MKRLVIYAEKIQLVDLDGVRIQRMPSSGGYLANRMNTIRWVLISAANSADTIQRTLSRPQPGHTETKQASEF